MKHHEQIIGGLDVLKSQAWIAESKRGNPNLGLTRAEFRVPVQLNRWLLWFDLLQSYI